MDSEQLLEILNNTELSDKTPRHRLSQAQIDAETELIEERGETVILVGKDTNGYKVFGLLAQEQGE